MREISPLWKRDTKDGMNELPLLGSEASDTEDLQAKVGGLSERGQDHVS